MNTTKRQAWQALAHSLRTEPNRWSYRSPDSAVSVDYHGEQSSTNLSLWVCMGSASIYKPSEVKFGWWGWWHLRRAYRYWHKTTGRYQVNALEQSTLNYVGKLLV